MRSLFAQTEPSALNYFNSIVSFSKQKQNESTCAASMHGRRLLAGGFCKVACRPSLALSNRCGAVANVWFATSVRFITVCHAIQKRFDKKLNITKQTRRFHNDKKQKTRFKNDVCVARFDAR